jgi:uncharacterized protein
MTVVIPLDTNALTVNPPMNITQCSRVTALLALTIGLTTIPRTTNAGSCFVWRVTNTPAPCYLVGTLHALRARDYPLPAGYYQALGDSKRLVFEMPMMNPASKFWEKFCRAAAYPQGDYIQRHVHPKTWDIIKASFGNQSMLGHSFWVGKHYVEHGIEELRPWAIAGFWYGIPGYSDVFSDLGVDNYFAYEGHRKGKELGALETDDEHVEVLHGMDDIESELLLLDAIVHRDKEKDWEEKLRTSWKHGDIAGVREYMARFGNLNPGAHVKLLDYRNVKWIPKIKADFDSGKPTSIVVGSGHMLGPNGLIALLRKQGYQFEQL